MNVQPLGLPAALHAWHASGPEPVLILRCAAAPDCGAEVGAVYASPKGFVVESRITVPEKDTPSPSSRGWMPDLDSFAGDIGVVGILDDFEVSTAGGDVEVSAAAGTIETQQAGDQAADEAPQAGDQTQETDQTQPATNETTDEATNEARPEAGSPQPDDEREQVVKAQIDLISTSHYWHNPNPLCPEHGKLQLDRLALDRAVRHGETTYEAPAA